MTHNHTTAPERHRQSGNIALALLLNLGFTALEIVGGLWTNSMAILADAIHDLGDSFSLAAAWYFERYSQRPGNERFSYGYRRFSLVGALISTTVLVAGSIVVLAEAVPRLFRPEPAYAPGMVALAVVGVVVNGAAVLRLKGEKGLNAKMVAWHLLEDVLGWLVILITAVVLLFKELPVLDPALSILITLYVLRNVLANLGKTMNVLLQGTPAGIDLDAIQERINRLDGIDALHHTHLWSQDGITHVFTTHAVVPATAGTEELLRLKNEIRRILEAEEITHSTIEFEFGNEVCGIGDANCHTTQNDRE